MEKRVHRILKRSAKSMARRKPKKSTIKNASLIPETSRPTVGDVDKAIIAQNASWFVNKKLNKNEIPPHHGLGLDPKDILPAKDTPPVDFAEIFKTPPINPHILNRLVYEGFISREKAKKFHKANFATEYSVINSEPVFQARENV